MILKRGDKYRTIATIQRYGQDLEETTLHFDSDTRTTSIGKTKEEEDVTIMEKAIFEFLQGQEEPLTEAEIMKAIEGRTGVKKKGLRSLFKQELVTREGKGGKGDPFKYSGSLVPTIDTGTTKPENEITSEPLTINDYSGSGAFPKGEESGKLEEEKIFAGAGAAPLSARSENSYPKGDTYDLEIEKEGWV
jgi:hypothetical protein